MNLGVVDWWRMIPWVGHVLMATILAHDHIHWKEPEQMIWNCIEQIIGCLCLNRCFWLESWKTCLFRGPKGILGILKKMERKVVGKLIYSPDVLIWNDNGKLKSWFEMLVWFCPDLKTEQSLSPILKIFLSLISHTVDGSYEKDLPDRMVGALQYQVAYGLLRKLYCNLHGCSLESDMLYWTYSELVNC